MAPLPRLNRHDATLASYLRAVAAHPTLSEAQWRDIARAIAEGGEPADAARHELICAHLGMVVDFAHHLAARDDAFPDLVQEGSLGLVQAAAEYDPDGGVSFSAHAAWSVWSIMLDASHPTLEVAPCAYDPR